MKKPSVSVVRGVIRIPSSDNRAALRNMKARSPSAFATSAGGCTENFGMAREETAHLRAVFLVQYRTGHVSNAPTGFEQGHGAVEDFRLLLLALFERAGPHAPLGVRIAPPGAGAGAGRVDQHQIAARGKVGDFAADRFRRAHLHVARARAFEAVVDRRQPPLVVVGGENLPLVLHHGGERQRLAAGAGA